MTAPIRIGLIGSGNISRAHARGYLASPDLFQVVAVCDGREELARQRASQLGGAKVFTDYHHLLDLVDAVDICLPHHLHCPVAVDCARAGKHILVEKPIANTLQEADQMVEEADKAGVILMVAHNQRFLPVYEKAKELVDQGLLGRIYLARADHNQFVQIERDHWLWKKETAGGGAFIGSGIHRVDLLRWLVGEVIRVWHRQVPVPERFSDQVEAASVTLLEFEDGAIGEVTCSWTAYGASKAPWYELIMLYGTDGTLHNVGGLYIATDQNPGDKGEYRWVPVPQEDSFVNEIRHFGQCILEGQEPRTSGREGRKTLAVVLAAYRSHETGGPVCVQQ